METETRQDKRCHRIIKSDPIRSDPLHGSDYNYLYDSLECEHSKEVLRFAALPVRAVTTTTAAAISAANAKMLVNYISVDDAQNGRR